MQSKPEPMLAALTEEWKRRGWSLASLRTFRMEGDGGAGTGGSGDGGTGGAGGSGGDGGQGGGNGNGGAGDNGAGAQGGNEPDFPPNTPVAEMTDKQAAAYWKHQSRKHEARAGQRADYDEIKKKADEYDALAAASRTEQERAVETAKNEGAEAARAEERSKAAVRVVDAEMRAAGAARGVTTEQLAPLLEPLDRTKFLTDTGEVDMEKVTSYVAGIQPAGESGNNGGKPTPKLGQGRRDTSGAKPSVSTGAERYAERHKKPGATAST